MGTIDKLNKIKQSKTAIKAAIIAKGQTVGDKMSEYAAAIANISSGGSSDELLKQIVEGTMTELVIPDGVSTIRKYAFESMESLTSVTIPNSVTSLGTGAFSNCTGLTSVTIPNSVITIGDTAFLRCSGLTSVTIPNSVTSIGNQSFSTCTSITSITIPNSVTSIGNFAFSYCSSLTSITYEGTIVEWNAMTKRYGWNDSVPATSVVCSDGTVTL